MEEPRKSEMEFKEQLSKLFNKYRGRISRVRMKQFLTEYLSELNKEGIRAG